VANVLFGDYNPAGRLPVTYYKSVEQLPPFDEYDMKNRTYKYFKGEPLYPFGFGLSYTSFKYSNLRVKKKAKVGSDIMVEVNVNNTGDIAGEEVVQLYLKDKVASTPRPVHQLEGFERITLQPGETKTVTFTLDARQFSIIGDDETRVIEPGDFVVFVGDGQPGVKGSNVISTELKLTGKKMTIE
jgi:beta-glucosidase